MSYELKPEIVEGLRALGFLAMLDREIEMDRITWVSVWDAIVSGEITPQSVYENLRVQADSTSRQATKKQNYYDYSQGPMYFIGQQLVRAMQDAGYPAKIVECKRSWDRQKELLALGRTTVGPGNSAHNYAMAVDICHETLGWNVDMAFWETLAACVRIVAEKFGVHLRHGYDWDGDGVPVPQDPDESFFDAAHVEWANWRRVRELAKGGEIDDDILSVAWHWVLPDIAKEKDL